MCVPARTLQFYQGNVPIHTSVIAITDVNNYKVLCSCKVASSRSYSLDLPFSYYFSLSELEKKLSGKKFANNEDVVELDGSHHKEDIELLNIVGRSISI